MSGPAKPCKACGGAKPPIAGVRYCTRCRETVCPECRSYGGHHQKQCLYIHRARRVLRQHFQGLGPTKMPRQDVVSREDIRALYEAQRLPAIRYAHSLGCNGDSEDVVQNVILWLIERQDYLREPPTRAYFFTAVKHEALMRAQSSYIQRTVWVDPPELVDMEAMEASFARGRPRPAEVRLPAHLCRGCGSDTTPGSVADRLCGECRSKTCRECERYGGGHSPGCSLRCT